MMRDQTILHDSTKVAVTVNHGLAAGNKILDPQEGMPTMECALHLSTIIKKRDEDVHEWRCWAVLSLQAA